MKKEFWKDVPEYEGLYQVSTNGRVKSLKREVTYKDGRKRIFEEKILTPRSDKGGYQYVILSKNDTPKTFKIHRLVAQCFIPNKSKLPQVNHKDENKKNNCVSNLEWCSAKYNINYGSCRKRATQSHDYSKSRNKINWKESQAKRVKKLYKPIWQCKLNGERIKKYRSAKDVNTELGFDASSIAKCCKGKLKTVHGYVWKYA